jgi:hypothetical protein
MRKNAVRAPDADENTSQSQKDEFQDKRFIACTHIDTMCCPDGPMRMWSTPLREENGRVHHAYCSPENSRLNAAPHALQDLKSLVLRV